MSRLASLRTATTLSEVATLLQFKPAALSFILFKQPDAKKYKTFDIPKRQGGKRTIKAPVDALKLVQRRLSDLLQDCADEINKGRKDRIAHGFKRNRSIITNARQHRHRRYVFNVDLEDFFPSINFGRVRGFFIKDGGFGLNENVATVIAQIACHANSLPQGSPCSPVISNLIAQPLDMHMVRLASAGGCIYSRYADDLTFSTGKKDFPAEIAVPAGTDPHMWMPGEELRRLITYSGFKVNANKTHMQYRTSRQEVTGLVVNQKINVRREYHHNVRAMVHSLVGTGSFELYGLTKKDGIVSVQRREGSLSELHGMLGFIDSVSAYNQKNTAGPKRTGLTSKELAYRQFLIYKDFYAAAVPLIVCEGETDNVYLTHAIRSLAGEFPDLAEISADGKKHLRVRLYKYPQTSTARILGLGDGGSSALSRFISTYRKETDDFAAPGLKSPVIIVYDNDAGANGIRTSIKNASKKNVKGTEPYVHVVKNMYAVSTPLLNAAAASKIEDFFDLATKQIIVDGKTFNDGNDFDPGKHYGKKVFAHRVVRPRAESIDFGGFRPLLANVAASIRVHAEAVLDASATI